jgi:hypothetical protein
MNKYAGKVVEGMGQPLAKQTFPDGPLNPNYYTRVVARVPQERAAVGAETRP